MRNLPKRYFYPRSPCGERRHTAGRGKDDAAISIHALLAESDGAVAGGIASFFDFYPRSPCGERPTRTPDLTTIGQFLSTLSLRRATQILGLATGDYYISIHALLAESDRMEPSSTYTRRKFLSTLSLRRATYSITCKCRPAYHFYPRSPCGERPAVIKNRTAFSVFLSTLSLRRATIFAVRPYDAPIFLSTLSLRRATAHFASQIHSVGISIHALLAESDLLGTPDTWTEPVFLSTLSLRRATFSILIPRLQIGLFLSTLSLRRATICM